MIKIKIWKIIIKIGLSFFILSVIVIAIDLHKAKISSVQDISDLTKIKLYDKDGKVFYEVNNLHEASYVTLDEIGEIIPKVFIFSEDKYFYNHSGFNIFSITKAFFKNINNKSKIGGSTITQQYVKNIYLSNKKSIKRKIRELYYAIKLERIYTKDEILEGYLNTIYFANGIYGINDASYFYFGKEPKEITLLEATVLASIIKSPNNYEPIHNYTENIKRATTLLEKMKQAGAITNSEYSKCLNEKVIIQNKKIKRYSDGILYYKDYILQEIKRIIKKGRNLNIYTSFDSNLNEKISNYFSENKVESSIAAVVLDNLGHILSIYGGKEYKYDEINVALYGKRMIGSTIKPLLYYEALKNGMNCLSTFKSEPTTFYLGKDKYIIKNYNNQYENQKITMAYAIATSDNIYAVKTYLYLGPKKLIDLLKKFNVNEPTNYPSVSLGSTRMSLLKLCSIYNTLSQLGLYNEPKGVLKIVEGNRDIFIQKANPKELLNSSYTFILNELLRGIFDVNLNHKIKVTGNMIARNFDFILSAKSGLTDYDSYMVGFNPLYTVATWSGHLDDTPLVDLSSQRYPKQLFAFIFNQLMNDKNKNIWYKKPNDVTKEFTDPTGFNTGYQKNMYFIN